ncbi:MAG: hypothetical protein AB1689_10990 [Thermodesulfobacteriota bacterium]
MKSSTVWPLAIAALALTASGAAAACPVSLPQGCQLVTSSNKLPDKITSCFYIEGATGSPHTYEFLNVLKNGSLYFVEKQGETTDFRVSGLLVERGGLVQAGAKDCPYGGQGGKLEIGLWGADATDQGTKTADRAGILCQTNPGADPKLRCFPAGYDASQKHYCTKSNSDDPCSSTTPPATEPNNALLEPYGMLNFDPNPWGFKTIGVAYGGSLLLYGHKGAKALQDANWAKANDSNGSCVVPSASQSALDAKEMQAWASLTGSSWVRLTGQKDDASTQRTTLTFDRPVPDWQEKDVIVVGATDWYPSHSEVRTIEKVISPTQVEVDLLKFPHYTSIFDVGRTAEFTNPVNRTAVDTRAVVGLLSRSIKIYSRGDTATDDFPTTDQCMHDKTKPDCYFGGHLIVRQGFKDVQIQGVEFKQLGQGGRMGHYPVHFHLAKTTSYTSGTFVKDSSIWDSMTRFVVLHGTHDVNVSRNVGYLSLGHGYYIEDASEIRNKLCHNLGVSARAALQQYVVEQSSMDHWCGGHPPAAARVVPPILDGSIQNAGEGAAGTAAGSDTYMPVMYWMMNAYNEFVGNAAVSVHGFGSCFWLLGSAVSGPSRYHQFDGFASYNMANRQAPLLRFRGNTCTTSPLALPSTREIPPASNGLDQATRTGYVALANPYLSNGATNVFPQSYARPIINGSFQPYVNGLAKQCANQATPDILKNNAETCVMTVLDRFATSFNWAEVNFGSIWLRPWFYLFSNGAVTDQLFGGLGFVTGGDWQQALPGYLALAKNSLFVGTTQPQTDNLYAKRSGPLLTVGSSDNLKAYGRCKQLQSTCNLEAEGTGLWRGAFQPKRLITIYDGPTYADGNTFLNVGAWQCNAQPCKGASNAAGCMGLVDGALPCGIYSSTTQPAAPSGSTDMVVLDAAIGWKQPNGFYYPPAFNYRRNAFLNTRNDPLNQCFTSAPGDYKNATFKPGSCRHNVVDRTADYLIGNVEDLTASPGRQSGPLNQLDSGTIDFATILLDLDGSLTGSTSKIDGRTPPGLTTSLSRNHFFDAPSQSPECLSYGLQTSPYTFLTTAMGKLTNAPSAASNAIARNDIPNAWPQTPAVAIYRQWKLKSDVGEKCGSVCAGGNYGCPRASFMGMAAVYQSPFLTMTEPPGLESQPGALYYLDTNSGAQSTSCVHGSASLQPAQFTGGDSFVVYNIFPQRDSVSSYQLYVGNGVSDLAAIDFRYVRVTIHEIQGSNQAVTDACDPRQDGAWCHTQEPLVTLKDGILTVKLDHRKLLKDEAFSIAKRAKYEQCMPRDLCYFDDNTNKCRSCLTNPSAPGCLRKGDFLPADVSSMNRADAAGSKPLDSVCEDWAQMVSGQVKIGGDNVASSDCPNGGCLGFAFKLPQGFQPQPYETVEANQKLSKCFLASAWVRDVLVQRKKGPQSLDPQCGAPRMQTPDQEFCTDPTLDLAAVKDGVLDQAAPTTDGADDPSLVVAGGEPVRSVVAFDDAAVDSFIAGGAFTRATLELTLRDASADAYVVDAHPLLKDFVDQDPGDDIAVDEAAPQAVGLVSASSTGRILPRRVLGKTGRRLPRLPREEPSPPKPPTEPPPGGDDDQGDGVTWLCAWALVPTDDGGQCEVAWESPGGDYGDATAPPATVAGAPGAVVAWDVTADVEAGVTRWLLRSRDESEPGAVAFYSEEAAEAAGDPDLAPRLVLE